MDLNPDEQDPIEDETIREEAGEDSAEPDDASLPPDLDRAATDDWPARSIPPTAKTGAVRIVMRQSVLNQIHEHGLSSPDAEICGVFVGRGYRDPQGPFVYIEHIIRGQHSDSHAAQVTFTAETWNHIHNRLDADFPELRILGWYHTHPGFGVFLSGMDRFIQENYFSGSDQMAFVYDPHSGEEGLFVWREGEAVRDSFLIEPDEPEQPFPFSAATARDEPPATAGAGPLLTSELEERLARMENRQRLVFVCLAGVLLAALVASSAAALLSDFRLQRAFEQREERAPSFPPPNEQPLLHDAADRSQAPSAETPEDEPPEPERL
ncbi:Mov34/MPN/PAD-1 family protein [Lignipirellula cremea]|uniref:Mov34/MPN/PAD-1 family protein n=1 Tax=Lignipirellula cremea TaxID=2528010 RepID=A0A518DNF9_9BACT|nr:Mov34/MPN/PAD-1 family protein [Lignipirellula cremea]QDU93377.1 Mov34/MPN/PAD-1 family protein [Lignipirellula cremea]